MMTRISAIPSNEQSIHAALELSNTTERNA